MMTGQERVLLTANEIDYRYLMTVAPINRCNLTSFKGEASLFKSITTRLEGDSLRLLDTCTWSAIAPCSWALLFAFRKFVFIFEDDSIRDYRVKHGADADVGYCRKLPEIEVSSLGRRESSIVSNISLFSRFRARCLLCQPLSRVWFSEKALESDKNGPPHRCGGFCLWSADLVSISFACGFLESRAASTLGIYCILFSSAVPGYLLQCQMKSACNMWINLYYSSFMPNSRSNVYVNTWGRKRKLYGMFGCYRTGAQFSTILAVKLPVCRFSVWFWCVVAKIIASV